MLVAMSKLEVLVIRSWTDGLDPVRAALAKPESSVALTCVDFEAALWAAVSCQRFDAVIFDRAAPVSPDAVVECLRAHRHDVPMVELGDVATLAERLKAAIAPASMA
jgi:hypothetical protein